MCCFRLGEKGMQILLVSFWKVPLSGSRYSIALNLPVTGDREALEEWMKTRYANAPENTEELRGFRIEVKKRRIALDKETEREHRQSSQSRIPSVAAM